MRLYFDEIKITFKNFSILNLNDLRTTLQTLRKYKILINNSYLTKEFDTINLTNIINIDFSDENLPFELEMKTNDLTNVLELMANDDFLKWIMQNQTNFNKFCSYPNLVSFITPKNLNKMIEFFQSDKKLLKVYICRLFFCILTGNFYSSMVQYIMDHEVLIKFLTLDLFCLLYHYVNEVNIIKYRMINDSFENKTLWDLHWEKILSIKKINFSNHPCLSSISYKSLFLAIMEQFIFGTKLQAPEVLHNNQYFKMNRSIKSEKFEKLNMRLKEKVLNFAEEMVKSLISTDLQEYDDFTGDIILQLTKVLPNLEVLNLNRLNLNDDFCEKIGEILMTHHFLHGKTFHLSLCHNYRITNVGLKALYLVFKCSHIRLKLNSTLTIYEEKKLQVTTIKNLQQQNSKILVFGQVELQTQLKKIHDYLDFFQIQNSKKTTIILNRGLGFFIIKEIGSFLNKKTLKFCYDCETKVCSKCHSFHRLDNKCLNKVSISLYGDCKTFQNQIRKKHELQKDKKCVKFSKCLMNLIFIPLFWIIREILSFFQKIVSTLDKKTIKLLQTLSFDPNKKKKKVFHFNRLLEENIDRKSSGFAN